MKTRRTTISLVGCLPGLCSEPARAQLAPTSIILSLSDISTSLRYWFEKKRQVVGSWFCLAINGTRTSSSQTVFKGATPTDLKWSCKQISLCVLCGHDYFRGCQLLFIPVIKGHDQKQLMEVSFDLWFQRGNPWCLGRHGSKWLQPKLRDPISHKKKAEREWEGGQGCKLSEPAPGDTIPTQFLQQCFPPWPFHSLPKQRYQLKAKCPNTWAYRDMSHTNRYKKWTQKERLMI